MTAGHQYFEFEVHVLKDMPAIFVMQIFEVSACLISVDSGTNEKQAVVMLISLEGTFYLSEVLMINSFSRRIQLFADGEPITFYMNKENLRYCR